MCYNCVLVASTWHIFVLNSTELPVLRSRPTISTKKNYLHVFYCTYYRIFDIEDINKNITS